MQTLEEIRRALERLTVAERRAIVSWLREQDGPGDKAYEVAEPKAAYAAVDPAFMTLEEFFEFEEHSEVRHEYVNGAVFAMSGPTLVHQQICHRLAMAFGNKLPRGGPCQVFPTGTQFLIQRDANEICYLPDIIVDCRRDAWGKNFVRYPTLVVEILSPSTQLTDRREKLQNYRLIDSVEEYVIVAQSEPKLTIHRRADGWRPQVLTEMQAEVEFRSIGLALRLTEIFADILSQ